MEYDDTMNANIVVTVLTFKISPSFSLKYIRAPLQMVLPLQS